MNLAGFSSDGIGWYSLWVAVIAVGFGVTNIVRFDDANTGLLWLQWAVLWTLFWVVLALGQTRFTELAGWLTVILSLTTCTIPGFLLLLGAWSDVPTWAVLASIGATVVALAALVRRPEAAPGPAGAPAAA